MRTNDYHRINGVTGRKRTYSQSSASSAPLVDILFVGNPGAGKSTLMNCLIGQSVFESGLVYNGTGMTTVLQSRVIHPFRWTDTPGLADTDKRKQAAIEITKALKSCSDGGVVRAKIFFVIMMVNGRFRPADILTMTLVLESAPIKYFGIIINQLGPTMHAHLKGPDSQDLKAKLFSQLPKATNFLYPLRRYNELEEKKDACVKDILPVDFIKFIFTMPENEYKPERVTDVKAITDEAQKEMETKMAQMEKKFEKERESYIKQAEDKLKAHIKDLKRDQEKINKRAKENYEALKKTHAKSILSMRQQHAQAQKDSADREKRMRREISSIQSKNQAEMSALRQQNDRKISSIQSKYLDEMNALRKENERNRAEFKDQLDRNSQQMSQQIRAAEERANQAQRNAAATAQSNGGGGGGDFLGSLIGTGIKALIGGLF